MFLSSILIPQGKVIEASMADLQKAHEFVSTNGIHPDEERYLFRVDSSPYHGYPVQVIVQTHREPIWRLPGYKCDVKQFSYEDIDISPGSQYAFHARLNACICKKTPDGRHVRVGVGSENLQVQWLRAKAPRHGFKVHDCAAIDEKMVKASPTEKHHKVTLRSVVVNGVLEVADSKEFLKALMDGIGHGKCYGFGLISLS